MYELCGQCIFCVMHHRLEGEKTYVSSLKRGVKCNNDAI